MFMWGLTSGVVAGIMGYTAIAVSVAQRLIRPHRRYAHIEPAALGLAYEDIWFHARGEAINIAAWHLPSPGAKQAVIVVHGLNRCRGREFNSDSLKLAEHLVHNNFTVLMLDLRGHGESDAAPQTYGIRERRDVLGAVDWLLARGYAPGAIGVLGTSMGGVAALGAMVEEPAVGGLIIDSAFADFTPMMRTHFQKYSKLPAFFLPGALLIGSFLTGEWLAGLRPLEYAQAIAHRPLLVIHARGDQLVPVSHAQDFVRASNAELWITDGTSHLGSFGVDPLAYNCRVAQFFTAALAEQATETAFVPTESLVAEDSLGELAISRSCIGT